MQWNTEDMNMYIHSKEYVDTCVIPLLPVSFNAEDDKLVSMAFQHEFLTVFTNEIEKQFKGRIFLSPSYTYSPSAEIELEMNRLNKWCEEAEAQGFNHILLFTMDPKWKKQERKLDGSLVWLPAGQVDSLQSEEAQKYVQSQIDQVTELIMAYWQE
ncbi:YpiF family protein [Pontibacillus yanchengensis]|uniref:DUF2487 domain-containing protein n=1 Tax=Pontibacillus yanchengensis Y32 TaxID=1385514 RepID=A0A0A2TFY9_9BACI|nr:YpiF family protein [Pontibacillus yanchengensis]KGP73021.1 hypothetical protein N782_07855 [Pontibacillus yanchengensis Y32]